MTITENQKHILFNAVKVGLTTALIALISGVQTNPALFGSATGIVSATLTALQIYFNIALPSSTTPPTPTTVIPSSQIPQA